MVLSGFRRYRLLQNRDEVLSSLTFTDALYWGADAILGVVFGVFIINEISGSTLLDVGLAFVVYRLTSALFSIPLGDLFDKWVGDLDEAVGVLMASVISTIGYLWLSLSISRPELFIITAMLGVARAIDLTAWRTLFNKRVVGKSVAKVMGVYETVMSVTISAAYLLAGFIGDEFGLRVTVASAAVLSVLAGISGSWLWQLLVREIKEEEAVQAEEEAAEKAKAAARRKRAAARKAKLAEK